MVFDTAGRETRIPALIVIKRDVAVGLEARVVLCMERTLWIASYGKPLRSGLAHRIPPQLPNDRATGLVDEVNGVRIACREQHVAGDRIGIYRVAVEGVICR